MSISNKARNIPKEYLGAFKKGHRFSSRDMIDEDFAWELLKRVEDSDGADQEAIDALLYLAKFNNEYHKNIIKKNDPNALHNTDELRKDLYSRENAKNRDVMSVQNQSVKRVSYKSKEDNNTEVDIECQADNWDRNMTCNHSPYTNVVEDSINEIIDNHVNNGTITVKKGYEIDT